MKGSVKFRLHGFWSESFGNLCMVGGGYTYNKHGKSLNLEAVLKLGATTVFCITIIITIIIIIITITIILF